MNEIAFVLNELDIKNNSGSMSNIEMDDSLRWGKVHTTDSYAELSEMKVNRRQVPNVKGMGARDAVYLLEEKGLRVRLSGMGKVVSQSISPGATIQKGQTISLTLR